MLKRVADYSDVPERLVPGTVAWELYELEHKQRYQWAARYCAGKRVLDAACGTGYGAEILARLGSPTVVGVDVAFEAIRPNGFSREALLTTANGCRLPFPDSSFDVVVSFETIEHVQEPESLLREFARVLKGDGLCICSSPNRDFQPAFGNKVANPFHISEMNYSEFNELFSRYFLVSERFSQTHSDSYVRHLGLLRELDARLRPIRFSRLLRLENKVRTWLGGASLNGLDSLPAQLSRAVTGDYVIESLEEASPNLLTFILVGRVK
jgi:SAM-dependent methyltransferase